MSSRSSSDSERTLVENGLLPHNADIEERGWALLDGHSLLQYIAEGEMAPPYVFEGIFGLITGNLPNPSDFLPPFEDTRWGDIPHPDQFEILSDDDSERKAIESHRVESGKDMQLPEVPTSTNSQAQGKGLNLQDFELKAGSSDTPTEWIVTLQPKGDSATPLMWCTLVHQWSFHHRGHGVEAVVTTVIKDLVGSMETFGEIFFTRLTQMLDAAQVYLSVIYTTDPQRMIVNPAWKREHIHQLRIRINGSLRPMHGWGTVKLDMRQTKALLDKEAEVSRRQLRDGNKCPSSEREVVIDPWDLVGKQMRTYYPENMQYESEAAFRLHEKHGAFASTPGNKPVDTWATWVHDSSHQKLRVNHISLGRKRGNALDLMGILQQSVDQAQHAADVVDVVVWDPPEEMYDAAIALADDAKIGLWFSVFKEEAGPWKVYTRWNPDCAKGLVWKQREFYCFAGSIDQN